MSGSRCHPVYELNTLPACRRLHAGNSTLGLRLAVGQMVNWFIITHPVYELNTLPACRRLHAGNSTLGLRLAVGQMVNWFIITPLQNT